MKYLAIGECMAELAPLADEGEFRLGFAGDTLNTAWYLRRLCPEALVSYLTGVGDDAISQQMLDFMQAAGIDTKHVARIAGRSVGLYLISIKDGERSFSYWRDTSAARLLAEDEAALERAVEGADLVYFSGITLAILSEAARDRFLATIRARRSGERRIVFDPNLRPRLWRDVQSMRAAIMQAASVSDIVLPSHEDEAAYFGDADPQATIDRYAKAGARCVIVKNGDGPVHFVDGYEQGCVVVEPVNEVVDTTAAGDSFNAGYLAGLDAGLPVASCVRLGAAVAGQVIRGKGALVELVPGGDVDWRSLVGH